MKDPGQLPGSPAASFCLPVQAYYRRGGPAQICKVCPKEKLHPVGPISDPISGCRENFSPESLLPSSLRAGPSNSDCKTCCILSSDLTLGPHKASIHLSLAWLISIALPGIILSLSSSLSLSPYLPLHFLSPHNKITPFGFLWHSVTLLNGIITSPSIRPFASYSLFHSLGHMGECEASMHTPSKHQLLESCLDILVLHLVSPWVH